MYRARDSLRAAVSTYGFSLPASCGRIGGATGIFADPLSASEQLRYGFRQF
jgi:hypothetical protein